MSGHLINTTTTVLAILQICLLSVCFGMYVAGDAGVIYVASIGLLVIYSVRTGYRVSVSVEMDRAA